jgi:hypothetical protein
MKQTILVLVGAAAGGLLGYFAFFWLAGQGLYGLILPGGLLGLGAGIGKNRSLLLAAFCGICAVALGLFTEWRFAPFRKDDSLGYFLTHVQDLKPITLLLILLGGLLGFWVPFRRIESRSHSGRSAGSKENGQEEATNGGT